jgi:hypothetical protein
MGDSGIFMGIFRDLVTLNDCRPLLFVRKVAPPVRSELVSGISFAVLVVAPSPIPCNFMGAYDSVHEQDYYPI